MKIIRCVAKEINDSRGMSTVEVEMSACNGQIVRPATSDNLVYGDFVVIASVPAGKSTGSREARELRDEDGVGVSRAVANVNDVIAPEIVGRDVEPDAIDQLLISLDGTDDKSNLGANAMLAVSIAAVKLGALVAGVPLWKFIADENDFAPSLPRLFVNVLNGGAHADFRLPFQEYMIVPDVESVAVGYSHVEKIIEALERELESIFDDVPMGDEGGYSPKLKIIEEPFEILSAVISDVSDEVFIATDVAASEFYKNPQGLSLGMQDGEGVYSMLGKSYTADELLQLYKKLTKEFNLKSIEDPFEELDVQSFAKLTNALGGNVLIVGDDLTTTNPSIITQMVEKKAVNAVIIKPNQIGTMKETYEAILVARRTGLETIVSHRSGETMDTFIADLAVGSGSYGIKAGSPLQKERRVKYERLIEIEREMTQ